MKRIILGVVYCILWYMSILVGFFLFICPLLPLVFFHPKLYRKWSEIIFGMWEPFPVALMEIFFGIRTVLTGDRIDPFERSLLIMNHRTRLDWNFLWVGLFHCCHPYSHALKYVLKAGVMHLPGPGWVMQTCSFLFIHRNWAKDQKLLEKLMLYLDMSDQPYQTQRHCSEIVENIERYPEGMKISLTPLRAGQQTINMDRMGFVGYNVGVVMTDTHELVYKGIITKILLFPEGTDLSPSNISKSHKYADEHNLDRYYNVLHPKTTGFAFLAHKMKLSGKINAVYDITIGYPGEAPQNESELLKGNFPEQVHFNIKRYSATDLPLSESDLRTWLNNIWKKKEISLDKFRKTGSFSPLDENTLDESNSLHYLSQKLDVTSTNNPDSNVTQTSNTTDTIFNGMHGKNSVVDKSNTSASQESFATALESAKGIENQGEITNEEAYEMKAKNSFLNSGEIINDENFATTSKFSGNTPGQISNSESESSVNRYRPSHLLYLTFIFWVILIYLMTHQFLVNFYVQMWVLIHTLFFSCISIVSDGFHHIIASIYFYRYNINWKTDKKNP